MKQTEILKELERIARQNKGILRAADVVEFARNEDTVLHQCFTWDDSEAAEKWRLHQARNIILKVNITFEEREDVVVRAFVSLKSERYEEGGGYRTMAAVISDPETYQEMLDEAYEELVRIRTKYRDLKELGSVFMAIDQLSLINK